MPDSRRKGNREELKAIHEVLEPFGFEVQRNLDAMRRGTDGRDLQFIDGTRICVQVKSRAGSGPLVTFLEEAVNSRDPDELPVLLMHYSRKPWIIVLDARDFFYLYRFAEAMNGGKLHWD